MQSVVINGIEYVPLVKEETASLESYYESKLIKHFNNGSNNLNNRNGNNSRNSSI